MFKKIFSKRKLSHLIKEADYHFKAFNYHHDVVEKTSDEIIKIKHQQLLIEHLTNLENVNKKISLLEAP